VAEAPEIAKDPVADSTDTYAFVSPDAPDTVTMITNHVPLEGPAGPNSYEFGDDVLYEINVDSNGDGVSDITYRFKFTTELNNTETFLYKVARSRHRTARHGTAVSSTGSPRSSAPVRR
jgi:Domain of unknown function (DUF4331)